MGGGIGTQGEVEQQFIKRIADLKINLDQALGDANAQLATKFAQEIAALQGELKAVQLERIKLEQEQTKRDEDSKKIQKLAAITASIDLINRELNQLRAAIKRGFAAELFDAPKWTGMAQQFNQRLEKQIFELDALVDMSDNCKAERKAQVVRIGQYHEIVDQLIIHLGHSSAFYSWLT